jgi:hypothetical protein
MSTHLDNTPHEPLIPRRVFVIGAIALSIVVALLALAVIAMGSGPYWNLKW